MPHHYILLCDFDLVYVLYYVYPRRLINQFIEVHLFTNTKKKQLETYSTKDINELHIFCTYLHRVKYAVKAFKYILHRCYRRRRFKNALAKRAGQNSLVRL